jgi:hydrogenase maturation protein HypF
MNRYLIEHVASRLARGGFSVAVNRDLPPNDASVSFGQAVVALARNTQTA